MSLDIFYKENKYKMIILHFCKRIGKMIMKILPDCIFFNILENRQTMTNFSTVINIPRFGPFLVLESKMHPSFSSFYKVSLGLENSAWIRRWKILRKNGAFSSKKCKKCCAFRWGSSRKTPKESDNITYSKFKTRRSNRKICK